MALSSIEARYSAWSTSGTGGQPQALCGLVQKVDPKLPASISGPVRRFRPPSAQGGHAAAGAGVDLERDVVPGEHVAAVAQLRVRSGSACGAGTSSMLPARDRRDQSEVAERRRAVPRLCLPCAAAGARMPRPGAVGVARAERDALGSHLDRDVVVGVGQDRDAGGARRQRMRHDRAAVHWPPGRRDCRAARRRRR